jgi:glycosyltransferase involved in cell wall biosynthesis
MKILIVNEFFHLQGGVERYLRDLLRSFQERNIAFDYLCREETSTEHAFATGQAFDLPQLWDDSMRLRSRTRADMDAILRKSNPDLVYLHNVESPSVISAMASFAPTIRYVHHHKATCPDGKRMLKHPGACCTYPTAFACMLRAHLRRCMPRSPGKAWRAYRRAKGTLSELRRLPKLLVASNFMKHVLARNTIPKERIEVLHLFSPWRPQKWTRPERQKGLLFVGRLVPGKGILELIKLLSGMAAGVQLEIVGDGVLMTQARQLAKQLGLEERVIFSGWLTEDRLKESYLRNPLLVIPSSWPEPFGLVGLEAASLCRPAVAFDVGGIGEWLKDKVTGRIVRPGHLEEMAKVLEELLDAPERVRQYGEHACEFVMDHFSVERHVDRLTELFDLSSGSTSR